MNVSKRVASSLLSKDGQRSLVNEAMGIMGMEFRLNEDGKTFGLFWGGHMISEDDVWWYTDDWTNNNNAAAVGTVVSTILLKNAEVRQYCVRKYRIFEIMEWDSLYEAFLMMCAAIVDGAIDASGLTRSWIAHVEGWASKNSPEDIQAAIKDFMDSLSGEGGYSATARAVVMRSTQSILTLPAKESAREVSLLVTEALKESDFAELEEAFMHAGLILLETINVAFSEEGFQMVLSVLNEK